MDDQLEIAGRELKQHRSILQMMKGNTPADAPRKLEIEWLASIRDRIKDLETAQ
jgi:hypothetical protein